MASHLFGAKPLSEILSIERLGINFSDISIKVQHFSFMKMHLKLSSVQWRPFCPGGDELTGLINSRHVGLRDVSRAVVVMHTEQEFVRPPKVSLGPLHYNASASYVINGSLYQMDLLNPAVKFHQRSFLPNTRSYQSTKYRSLLQNTFVSGSPASKFNTLGDK